MPNIQIRNVPEDVHRTFKARAAKAGMSLSDYLLAELQRIAEVPTMEEFVELIRSRPMIRSRRSAADLIREDRDTR